MKNIYYKMNSLNDSKLLKYIIFYFFLIITFILVLNHEIWTDEAQAWVIARDLSFVDIIKQMRYEGHPCLWHLILAIPAKLGLPVLSMNIISWIFIGVASYLIIFHAKWNIIVKMGVLFNPTFLFFLPVIARCYSLIAVLLCIWIICYPNRHKYPIIYTSILCLLANTHIVICGFVGIASILFIIECIKNYKNLNKKKFITVILIFLIAFCFLCIQILPSFKECPMVYKNISLDKLKNIFIEFGYYFFPHDIVKDIPWIMLVIFIPVAIFLFFHNKKLTIIYLITLLIFTFIHMYWPFTMYERTCLLFVIIIVLNIYNKNWLFQLMLIIIITIINIDKFHHIDSDLYGPFSDSKTAATWINNNVAENSLLIFLNEDRYVSIVPYINKDITFYNIRSNTYQAHITWKISNILDKEWTSEKIESLKEEYDNIYLLVSFSHDSNIQDCFDYVNELLTNNKISLMYASSVNISPIECFNIYKVNNNCQIFLKMSVKSF